MLVNEDQHGQQRSGNEDAGQRRSDQTKMLVNEDQHGQRRSGNEDAGQRRSDQRRSGNEVCLKNSKFVGRTEKPQIRPKLNKHSNTDLLLL